MTYRTGLTRVHEWSQLANLSIGLVVAVMALASKPWGMTEQTIPPMQDIGKTKIDTRIIPAGALRFNYAVFQALQVDDLWVDAMDGDDGVNGLTPATAFRTIQRAADLAGPGTTVHIMPGVYRETVWPLMNGSAAEPALYLAENGPGTAIIRGSEPASSLTWTQLTTDIIGLPPGVDPTDIYYTDLSAWGLDGPPRFVVELDGSGEVIARLPLAREPDWEVATEWKYHEFWWASDEQRIFHIWAHPWEFQKKKDIEKLRYLLGYVSDEMSKGRIQSIEMADLARKAMKQHRQV